MIFGPVKREPYGYGLRCWLGYGSRYMLGYMYGYGLLCGLGYGLGLRYRLRHELGYFLSDFYIIVFCTLAFCVGCEKHLTFVAYTGCPIRHLLYL